MKELYDKLDEHFAHAAHELFKCAPRPDSAILIRYVLACLKCFSAGARSISCLLNYLNEHYITPAVNDGRGWFDDDDRADVVATIGMGYLVEGKDRRKQELKKWGYKRAVQRRYWHKQNLRQRPRVPSIAWCRSRLCYCDVSELNLSNPSCRGQE
jgi:hypothetical protein